MRAPGIVNFMRPRGSVVRCPTMVSAIHATGFRTRFIGHAVWRTASPCPWGRHQLSSVGPTAVSLFVGAQ